MLAFSVVEMFFKRKVTSRRILIWISSSSVHNVLIHSVCVCVLLQWAPPAAATRAVTPPAGSTARPSSGRTPPPLCRRSTPSRSTVRATAPSCSTASATSPSPTPYVAPWTVGPPSALLSSFPFDVSYIAVYMHECAAPYLIMQHFLVYPPPPRSVLL